MSRKEKTDIAIGLIVVAIALGFILYYSFSGDTSFLTSDNLTHHTSLNEMKIDDKSYSRVKEDEIIDSEESSKKDYEESNATSEIDSSEIDTIIENSIIDTIDLRDEPLMDSIFEPTEKVFDFNDKEKNEEEEMMDKESGENEPVEQNIIEKEKTNPSTNANKCIIVIGSFAVNNNSTKLKSRLKNEGYDIFETPFQGLNRIGIYTSCNSDNLQRELRKIRSNYASDAVIFKSK